MGVQGGPMQGTELEQFRAEPYAIAACRLRRWDDAAKDPDAQVPALHHFLPLLAGLAAAEGAEGAEGAERA
jgi:gamma-butyrobetaine dioxygenase